MDYKIDKKQINRNNCLLDFLYYECARDAMFDLVNELFVKGYKDIFVPGYIGWSPREGSGIFDPLNAIIGLNRHYYKMTKELKIDKKYIKDCIKERSIILIVNYFGFRDDSIKELIDYAHKKNCIVIEDNAHGFYTYFYNGSVGADMTFFSLHKMFPFSKGGGLIIENNIIDNLHNIKFNENYNPFMYNYVKIANIRIDNYKKLLDLSNGLNDYFEPLRNELYLVDNVPQTFPIIIKCGNRNKIYDIMNDAGYGVVSLYHTMIKELQSEDYCDALWLSSRIMNLPIHQDVNTDEYKLMIESLVDACVYTNEG